MLALVNVNSSYASCESAFRSNPEGKPVVALSNNDGCIIASGVEAKALGVNMGVSYFRQKALFRHCGVSCSSSNYELYADMGSRVMLILEEPPPRVEVYSIDEISCGLTGVRNCRDFTDFGREIREIILQETRLAVGVGIAQTKTLAKLVNYAAKKWQEQTGGVVNLSNIERQRKLMATLPADEVWGVGRRISKKLNTMGIKTVCDLVDTDTRFIRKYFNVAFERTVWELRDEPCLALEEFMPVKQEIICLESLGERLMDYNAIREAICIYAARTAEKSRREHQFCRFTSMFTKTSPFPLNEPYYGNSASIKLLIPTQDSRETMRAATRSLSIIWREGLCYQKAGAMLSDFFSSGVAQLNLLDDNASRHSGDKLMAVLDTLNVEKGRGTLYLAG